MTLPQPIPDIEAPLSAYLKAQSSVTSLKARVVGTTPSNTETPWVRIIQLDAKAVGGSRSEHLIDWMVQFDCYAGKTGGQKEASALTRAVRAELAALSEREAEGVVITGVEFLSCPRIEDTEIDEPARQRFALTARIWGHA